MKVDEKKLAALDDAIRQIERQFGKGSIMKLGADQVVNIDVIPTGSLALDLALGVGGFPKGRVIEIYGPESSGKTTLALHTIVQSQIRGGTAAFIDAEHSLDPSYAKKLGVNTDELIISQPDSGEQALEITEALVRSGAVDVVVVHLCPEQSWRVRWELPTLDCRQDSCLRHSGSWQVQSASQDVW